MRLRAEQRLAKMVEILRGSGNMLIVMEDNPDPDAMASAVALRELANMHGLQCSMACGGVLGRAENRAMARYLGLNVHPMGAVPAETFDLVAMVDTQPGAGNNSLPPQRLPDIVIDHHPLRRDTRSCRFTDIRSHCGATSTIMYEYLRAAGAAIEVPVATALLYGIRSDTQDLGRESTQADIDAIVALYPTANKRMLAEIQRGSLPGEYYQLLYTALRGARRYGPCVITYLGGVDEPGMVAEVADLLLRNEDVHHVLCYAVLGKRLLLSIRTDDPNVKASKVAQAVVRHKGSGGGHVTFAGGQIPLNGDRLPRIEKLIRRRFLCHFHQQDAAPVSLVK